MRDYPEIETQQENGIKEPAFQFCFIFIFLLFQVFWKNKKEDF